jgi:uncharacterized protein (DUF2141 family)
MMRISSMIALAAILSIPAIAQAADVKVDLSGVRAGGDLYVQLQTRSQFMTGARAYGQIVRAPAAGALSVTVKDVAPGDYAVTIWHDDNSNRKFDVDPATGRPTDGWATVNAEALRGPPAFDQVKSTVGDTALTLALPLHYGR